jgi:predicted amidohydrolase
MHIIGCQIDSGWEDKAAIHDRVRALLDASAPARDSLVILPEMFATGFSMNVPAVTDTPARLTQDFLARAAADYGVYLLGGVVTTGAGGRGRNQCVVYSPAGKELARYTKMQPFTLGGESRHYEAGVETCLFTCQEFKVAPFICYDLRFPEIFRIAARRGAQLIVVIASWPSPRAHHWVRLLEARAIENQAYVVGVNRCGRDPQHTYNGESLIVDPRGQVLAHAGGDEGVISAELDLGALLDYRRALPFLEDMRSELVR